MLEVLLWLDRFDLDSPQITTKRLRSLVENNQMPLRTVRGVDYDCGQKMDQVTDGYEREDFLFDGDQKSTLSIFVNHYCEHALADVKLQTETDVDAMKAALYLSSCFVRYFNVALFCDTLPRNSVIASTALIQKLAFCARCNFTDGHKDRLSETLNGIDDNRLLSLRRRGCNSFTLCPEGWEHVAWDEGVEKFPVTEEGILSYCFTHDEDLPVPGSRYLWISHVSITPAFYKKVVEASKNAHLECDVELCLMLQLLDVGNVDIGVPPSHSQEYDRNSEEHTATVSYNIPDHGNGIRLLIRFKSYDGTWNVTVRHGKKDHDEFFEREGDHVCFTTVVDPSPFEFLH